jgi:hypothetical protein
MFGLLGPLIRLIRRVERLQVITVLVLADGFNRINQRVALNQKELNGVFYRSADLIELPEMSVSCHVSVAVSSKRCDSRNNNLQQFTLFTMDTPEPTRSVN